MKKHLFAMLFAFAMVFAMSVSAMAYKDNDPYLGGLDKICTCPSAKAGTEIFFVSNEFVIDIPTSLPNVFTNTLGDQGDRTMNTENSRFPNGTPVAGKIYHKVADGQGWKNAPPQPPLPHL